MSTLVLRWGRPRGWHRVGLEPGRRWREDFGSVLRSGVEVVRSCVLAVLNLQANAEGRLNCAEMASTGRVMLAPWPTAKSASPTRNPGDVGGLDVVPVRSCRIASSGRGWWPPRGRTARWYPARARVQTAFSASTSPPSRTARRSPGGLRGWSAACGQAERASSASLHPERDADPACRRLTSPRSCRTPFRRRPSAAGDTESVDQLGRVRLRIRPAAGRGAVDAEHLGPCHPMVTTWAGPLRAGP